MNVEERLASLEERVTKLEKKTRKPRVEKPTGAIDQLSVDRKLVEILRLVPQDLQRDWLEIFLSADWVGSELKKAHSWCLANPMRSPKTGWGRFYNSWLLRSWERYRKTNPAAPRPKTPEEEFGF